MWQSLVERMSFYLLGLGSNIEPQAHLKKAILSLKTIGEVSSASPVLVTQPVGDTFHQEFCNQLVVVFSELPAPMLKQRLLTIETDLGREPKCPSRATRDRTIDIDILGQASSHEACARLVPEESYYQRVSEVWRDSQEENV